MSKEKYITDFQEKEGKFNIENATTQEITAVRYVKEVRKLPSIENACPRRQQTAKKKG